MLSWRPSPATPAPTDPPTPKPTLTPAPTLTPTLEPTNYPPGGFPRRPTYAPTPLPTPRPTYYPPGWYDRKPTSQPTSRPTPIPTEQPTLYPSPQPTEAPIWYPGIGRRTPPPSPAPTPYPTRPTFYYPREVQYNKKLTRAVLAEKGCVKCYSETYDKITSTDDIENLCAGPILFVGASGEYFIGAFGVRSEMITYSDGQYSNNVLWYHKSGNSFGFKASFNGTMYGGINWPLNGNPGSGVGEFTNVVSKNFRKNMYSCPLP